MLLGNQFTPLPALLALVGGGSAVGAFLPNATTHINVHIPHSLHKNSSEGDGYPHRASSFGFSSLPTHGSMSLSVFLPEDGDICNFPLNKTVGHPGRPNDNTGHMQPWGPGPFALLADLGNCTFVTKARNAQMAGAAAVLFADPKCVCSDEHCVGNTTEHSPPCQIEAPELSDDGSAADVSIPAFLLSKLDADRMKETLRNDTPVLVDVSWRPPKVPDVINYTLWMDPLQNATKDLLRDLHPVALALGPKARFHPKFLIHNGTISKCHGNTGEGFCYNVCTNDGRYCYPSQRIPGSEVVAESLRRMCIWKHHGEEDGIGVAWWKYVEYFDEYCGDTNETFADPTCVQMAYDYAQVTKNDVDECVTDTGGIDGAKDEPNSLLDRALADKVADGVFMAPTIRVGGKALSFPSSAASAASVLGSICGGFMEGTVPEVCSKCLGSDDVADCAAGEDHSHDGGNPVTPEPKKERHVFRNIMWTFFIIGAVGGGGFWYYKSRDTHTDSSWNLRYAMLGDGGEAS